MWTVKEKQRTVLIPKKLRKLLLFYCEAAGIVSGSVFVTRNGKLLNRSNIWREMRTPCAAAHVEAGKVFPHNFRRLFAVSYYRMAKDVAKLADLLGHASISATRIYIMESGAEHELSPYVMALARMLSDGGQGASADSVIRLTPEAGTDFFRF